MKLLESGGSVHLLAYSQPQRIETYYSQQEIMRYGELATSKKLSKMSPRRLEVNTALPTKAKSEAVAQKANKRMLSMVKKGEHQP